jgi:site-specific DNA-methyltransferase (adenine-specific)
MKTLPDKSVDCFVCDLPYGQLSKEKGACAWDVKIDLKEFWEQVERLMKNDSTPIIHFCNTRFGFELYNSNPKWFRYDIVWDKGHGVNFLLANKMPMKCHEMIYVFSKKGSYYKRVDEQSGKGEYVRWGKQARMNKCYNIERGPGGEVGGAGGLRCSLSVLKHRSYAGATTGSPHPTAKPISVYQWILERYCPEGGTVLDPTAGSFNSIEAARDLGLNGIGIEKDEKFYQAAVARLGEIISHT